MQSMTQTGSPPTQMPSISQPATLYVGNIDEYVRKKQLLAHFSRYGPIHSLEIAKDKRTKMHKGFASVNFFNIRDGNTKHYLCY